MSLISEHRKTRENKSRIALHEFKNRFKKDSKTIYGFVEGKDDPCFYRGFLDNSIPEDWNVELWPSGGKDSVFEIYSTFDWRSFNKNQILFFVDKDLSEFTNRSIPNKNNIFTTDNYSIENDIVNSNTCDRILREICGFTELKYDDSDKIKDLFDKQLELFQKALIPVMSNIISWRMENRKACLNDICMKHLFKIEKGVLLEISKPKNKESKIVYIHDQCNLEVNNKESITEIVIAFEKEYHYRKFTRGKYLLWFLVEFCLSIHKDYNNLPSVMITKKPKMVVSLSQSNAIAIVGLRCKIPKTLREFLENTINKYVAIKEAA